MTDSSIQIQTTAMPTLTPAAVERFWRKIDERGPAECWPWLAASSRGGYGSFTARIGSRFVETLFGGEVHAVMVLKYGPAHSAGQREGEQQR